MELICVGSLLGVAVLVVIARRGAISRRKGASAAAASMSSSPAVAAQAIGCFRRRCYHADGGRPLHAGLVGRHEHSIHMAHVASVRIDTNLLFSDVFIETSGGQSPIHATATARGTRSG